MHLVLNGMGLAAYAYISLMPSLLMKRLADGSKLVPMKVTRR
jgi:hypothetical protein